MEMREDLKNGSPNNLYLKSLDGGEPVVFSVQELHKIGRGLVNGVYIRIPSFKPWYKAVCTIVICTLDRPESLNETLLSLTKQTFKNFEIVLITEKGNLSELRQKGLESAGGSVVSFIDDDVHCPTTWLQGTLAGFRKGVVGVSGPTTVTPRYERNRDVFKFKGLRRLQDWFFKVPNRPGHLSETGTPSMESNFESCGYQGEVQYLEACNMSVRKREALSVGGFSSQYIRTGEWCEVDLTLKLREKGLLWFSPHAKLYHRPSKAGVYKARIQTKHRWENFIAFQKKWEGKCIKKGWKTSTYRGFIWTYLKMKDLRMI